MGATMISILKTGSFDHDDQESKKVRSTKYVQNLIGAATMERGAQHLIL
jgi:hypothetical protein